MKMGNFVALASALIIGSANMSATAQDENSFMEQGKVLISAGYGIPNLGKIVLKIFEDEFGYSTYGTGPLHLKAHYSFSENISAGLNINYVKFGAKWQHTSNWNNQTQTHTDKVSKTGISFLGRMNFHFAPGEKFDPYFGFGLGYRTGSWTFDSTDPLYDFDNSIKTTYPVGFEFSIGMRYFFTDNIGLYTEFGPAKSLLQGGLTFAF